ncbi:MAG: pilus assembly protein N-terminal domain-containing protein [Longimicrobiales bacterium]|nr:pilus assembly protein N-terminal domain-containing protein [Longimicrobiales bacterium]
MSEPTVSTLRTLARIALLYALLQAATLAAPDALFGQEDVQTQAARVITVSRGSTAILTRPDSITRLSIADPEVAEPVPIPPNQVLINANNPGSTSLVVWGANNVARMYTIEVTADVASLQRQIDELFPDAGVEVTSTGSAIVLSGEIRDPQVVRKATELAETAGITLVNNLQAPPPEQVLLHVEFAEVSRSAMKELGTDLLRIINPEGLDDNWDFDDDDTHVFETMSEGFVNIMVEGNDSRLDLAIRALKNSGEFRSLAQPNLVTREGSPATFLAGGEFPFPTVQGGQNTSAVTIEWKEFGIRLNFLPTISNSGNIRLQVAPEVSSLDFANGLRFQGFDIPSILARRVETDVELGPGQTLAIGGLMDNTIIEDVNKIPILGDIPILGYFFKSESARQNRTELLVLVTPYILDPDDLPAPPLPTGDPVDWDWDGHIEDWLEENPPTDWMETTPSRTSGSDADAPDPAPEAGASDDAAAPSDDAVAPSNDGAAPSSDDGSLPSSDPQAPDSIGAGS